MAGVGHGPGPGLKARVEAARARDRRRLAELLATAGAIEWADGVLLVDPAAPARAFLPRAAPRAPR